MLVDAAVSRSRGTIVGWRSLADDAAKQQQCHEAGGRHHDDEFSAALHNLVRLFIKFCDAAEDEKGAGSNSLFSLGFRYFDYMTIPGVGRHTGRPKGKMNAGA